MKKEKQQNITIYDIYQIRALNARLTRDPAFFERKIRRWYSKTFYTALDQVYQLSWDLILRNYFESLIENMPYNEIYDLACKEFLPEIKELEQKKEDLYMKELEQEQQETLKKQKPKEIKINFDPEDNQ